MDDLVQLEHLKMEAQADARPLEDSVSFDATEEKCSIIRNGAHHEDTGDSQTETAGEHADLTMLLHKDERKASLQYFCPGCYSFVRAYRSANPQERVSPFAIVLLLVLFIIYVLNQADRLVLPVVIPAGLRCQSDESNECVSANATPPGNQSANASGADCIHFGDSEQGLLTGEERAREREREGEREREREREREGRRAWPAACMEMVSCLCSFVWSHDHACPAGM